MISNWMLHSVAFAALLALSALALERVALALGRPARWGWAGAIALSALLPLLVPWLPAGAGGSGTAAIGLGGVEVLAGASAGGSGPEAGWWVERALAAGWLLASTGLLLYLLVSLLWLERQRRRWGYGIVAERAVLVSAETGPAVVGFLWPEIVVPRWALACDAESQRLLIGHEREHLRAGDSHLLLGAVGALMLMPWNPALWWQVRRLRFAVEMDCDARVLRAHPRPRAYGLLLLEVGRRASRVPLPAAAFSEPRSLLERRIRMLSAPPRRLPRPALTAFALVAIGAAALACELPDPARPDLAALLSEREDAAASLRAPAPTPYTVPPALLTPRAEAVRTIDRLYPPALRAAGIGGTTTLWILVDESGAVAQTRVSHGSGHAELDVAAQHAMQGFRFTPARDGEEVVPVWIQLPVIFGERAAGEPTRAAPLPAPTAAPVPLPPDAAPPSATPTPLDALPQLLNRQEFGSLLERSYPPLLREAGVGGTAVVWVHIDRQGTVAETGVAKSSGREELDVVARSVLQQARFTPPQAGGRAVDAWIQLPVTFQAR